MNQAGASSIEVICCNTTANHRFMYD